MKSGGAISLRFRLICLQPTQCEQTFDVVQVLLPTAYLISFGFRPAAGTKLLAASDTRFLRQRQNFFFSCTNLSFNADSCSFICPFTASRVGSGLCDMIIALLYSSEALPSSFCKAAGTSKFHSYTVLAPMQFAIQQLQDIIHDVSVLIVMSGFCSALPCSILIC